MSRQTLSQPEDTCPAPQGQVCYEAQEGALQRNRADVSDPTALPLHTCHIASLLYVF